MTKKSIKRLTKADILAAPQRQYDTVDVPEWGGEVLIRSWTVAEADEVAKVITAGVEEGYVKNFREQIVARSVVEDENADGPMFSLDEIEQLGQLAPAAMNRVHKAALKLNKLETEAEEQGN